MSGSHVVDVDSTPDTDGSGCDNHGFTPESKNMNGRHHAGHISTITSVVPAKSGNLGMDLVFRDIDVYAGKKQILSKVSGMARRGEMMAVMGPSGAGKTTLFNTLAGRRAVDSGSVLIDGSPISRRLRRKICYVLQSDVFFPNLTLKETLTFTAMLRLPDTMSKEKKIKRVEEIIDVLDLAKCKNTLMGGMFMPGISGGEKKRASIACELLTNPQILLLDEPTSGLDSAIAFNLISTLKRYAQNLIKTVVVTIHQPSTQIFYMFDNLLLLCNGQMAYFGKSVRIMEFFSNIGLHSSLHYNPADFILEKVKETEEVQERILQAANAMRTQDSWPLELRSDKIITNKTSADDEAHLKDIQLLEDIKIVALKNGKFDQEPASDKMISGFDEKKYSNDLDIDQFFVENAKWQTSFWTQFSTLTHRAFVQARARILSKLMIVQVLALAVASGFIWFDLPRTEETLIDRQGFLYFICVYFNINTVFQIITSFPDERGVITKERASGAYRVSAYFFAKMTAECPLCFILPTLFCAPAYWMANMSRDPVLFICQLLIIWLSVFAAQGLGLIIGLAVLDFKTAITTATVVMLSMTMAGGFYTQSIPDWLGWFKYTVIMHYCYSAMLKVEFLYGEPFSCSPPNVTAIPQCTSLNSTFTGKEYLNTTQYTGPVWFDLTILLVYLIVARALAYLVLRFLRRPKSA